MLRKFTRSLHVSYTNGFYVNKHLKFNKKSNAQVIEALIALRLLAFGSLTAERNQGAGLRAGPFFLVWPALATERAP